MVEDNKIKCIKYPKIPQFPNIVKYIRESTHIVGVDENGKKIYDNTIPMPKIVFKGSVKLHGTNASVAYDNILV